MFSTLFLSLAFAADPTQDTKAAFAPLTPLVGGWKCTGRADDNSRTFWSEHSEWVWRFKDDDSWLVVTFEKGKHYTHGELRYDPKKKHFTLTLSTVEKVDQVFTGTLGEGKQKEPILTLDRTVDDTVYQFTLTVLHSNRHLYQLSTRPKAVESFTRLYLVGATKEGEPFANVTKGNECVVSGGTGTIAVSYKGATYYVCCSGCKDEFNADPEKYLKLAANKK